MGLEMQDENIATIHVPSGPSSFSTQRPNYDNLTLKQLGDAKDRLEGELRALGQVLDSHGVNMNTSLTTFDGYPRDDIDVAQVRVTRARIIHLKNDYKDLMNKIEKSLEEHHAQIKADMKAKQDRGEVEQPTPEPLHPAVPVPETPFAEVKSVEAGSPANEAGLRAGDLIRRFGGAIWSNHQKLAKIKDEVQNNMGKQIPIRVLRRNPTGSDGELDLVLTPRSGWGGRGSLGCYVVPI